MQKFGRGASLFSGSKAPVIRTPTLSGATRFPYGPFRFKTQLWPGADYEIQASTDLKNWREIAKNTADSGEDIEYVDSDAFKFSHRFYRIAVNEILSTNALGYVTVTLPPGFSLIANPLDGAGNTAGQLFKGWPEGTTLSYFDTRLFQLTENSVKAGAWTNPGQQLLPGHGAIFFNPTSEYKLPSFVGEVMQGTISVPIPAGFSVRSSLIPQSGHLVEDLGFPIAEGDVIHVFDRDRQQYVLHPFENGNWTAGPPIVGVGEAFWVAKNLPENWTRRFSIAG